MRVHLKGIHTVRATLADGRVAEYHYAWRSGPRLEGTPGSPEFIESYRAAHAAKLQPPVGTVSSLVRYYEETSEFRDLAERTKADYRKQLKLIETKFGGLPLGALAAQRTRGLFKDHRDEIAKRSRRQADYWWVVLARVFAVAKDRGRIAVNPCLAGGRLYGGSRRDVVWSWEDEELFLSLAPTHLHLPLLMGAWLGQREGDLLRVPWTAYNGKRIRLRQGKTGAYVEPPVIGPLKAALDVAAKQKGESVLILNNSRGKPWTEGGFRASFFKIRDKIGLKGLRFHDLRGTSVTRLALAGCTVPEIHVYTGLSPDDVQQILVKHYLHQDPAIAQNAGAKLAKLAEQRTKLQNAL